MNYSYLPRIRVLSALICLFALLIISKLFSIQIIHGKEFTERADRQYATPTNNMFERGSIFFKSKDNEFVSAASTISGFKVAINPKEISETSLIYEKINSIIPLDRDSFFAKANKKSDPYEEIANRLNKDLADKISALKLPGVSVYREKWRFYPGNELAAHFLGFVGFQGNELSGRTGIERYYNGVLSRNNQDLYVNFFAEVFSDISRTLFDKSNKEGDIITTIEPTVQNDLEKELQDVMKGWRSDAVGGIIINPKDGSIYAMAHLPAYDLNNYSKVKDFSVFSNPIVESVFEFGSSIKALTMAAGLDAGVVSAETTYNDKGFLILNNRQINNFDKKARGIVSMQEVLNQSLNTGSVFVMQSLGKERFKKYMLSYGVAEKTGIDLPTEISGLVGNLESGKEVEYATASFGQGIAFTPIEAVRAFSVLANGGYLITPHLVSEIDYTDGLKSKTKISPGQRVLSEKSAEEITKMLVTVVDKALLGGTVRQEHYSIAAKTGTAQMSSPDGGYYEDRYLHSFFGYFPAYNPKFLILLYNINPKGAQYASHTLTEPFINLVKFLIDYYNVAPDR